MTMIPIQTAADVDPEHGFCTGNGIITLMAFRIPILYCICVLVPIFYPTVNKPSMSVEV